MPRRVQENSQTNALIQLMQPEAPGPWPADQFDRGEKKSARKRKNRGEDNLLNKEAKDFHQVLGL